MSSLDDMRQRRLIWALVLAALTVSVMSTLGTPLIPTIAAEQGVSLDAAQWILTITLLVGAIATPVLGRLGDGPQRRTVLLATLGSALVGSVVAATATRFPQLLAGRALQGVGYGTVPLAISLAREHVTGERLHSGIATLSITVAVGAGLGFPVTGLIAQEVDFHAAFWFGAIFAAASFTAVALNVPRSRGGSAGRVKLDLPGALLLGVGLAAMLLAISNGAPWGWGSARVLALFGAAAVLLLVWTVVELRNDNPLVDLRLVSQRTIVGANLAALLIAVGMYIAMSLVNRLMQTPESAGYGFGATVFVTGLMLLPLALGSLVSQPLTRRVIARVGIGVVLPIGSLVVAGTLAFLALVHGSLADIAIATALLGVGVGATFAAMPALIVANVPPERTGSATSLNQVLRSVGGALGSAVGVAVLAAHHPPGAPFPDEAGYTVAFLGGALVCVVTAGLAFALAPRRRAARAAGGDVDADVELLMEESAVGAVGPSMFDEEDARPLGLRPRAGVERPGTGAEQGRPL